MSLLLPAHPPSFPTRERGLKLDDIENDENVQTVVPHAGTWIEMSTYPHVISYFSVVPHAGTWIEIMMLTFDAEELKSFPTRERGLKLTASLRLRWTYLSFPTRERGLKFHSASGRSAYIHMVVPHAGTWIEI